MSHASRRLFLQIGFVGAACACVAPVLAHAADAPKTKYVCPPCGCAADGKEFDAPGTCPECGMELIPKAPGKPGAPAPGALGSPASRSDPSTSLLSSPLPSLSGARR